MLWHERLYLFRPHHAKSWAGRKHGFSDAWEAFAVEVTRNAFMRSFLYYRARRRCSLCLHPFGGDCVVHHVSYDHVCLFGRRVRQATPGVFDPERVKVVEVPDCEACLVESRERFLGCAKRLRLVHSGCNYEISAPRDEAMEIERRRDEAFEAVRWSARREEPAARRFSPKVF